MFNIEKIAQNQTIKPYIDMNTKLRKKSKKLFLERFFQIDE